LFQWPGKSPSRLGPSATPAHISPITAGWRSFSAMYPKIRAATRTTQRSSKIHDSTAAELWFTVSSRSRPEGIAKPCGWVFCRARARRNRRQRRKDSTAPTPRVGACADSVHHGRQPTCGRPGRRRHIGPAEPAHHRRGLAVQLARLPTSAPWSPSGVGSPAAGWPVRHPRRVEAHAHLNISRNGGALNQPQRRCVLRCFGKSSGVQMSVKCAAAEPWRVLADQVERAFG
jgi:hypothetical protein